MVTKISEKDVIIVIKNKNQIWSEYYTDYGDALRGLAARFDLELIIKEG